MCVAFIAYNSHPDYQLIVASNRDEFLERPTLKLHEWNDKNGIIAGKDLTHGGIWQGVNKFGCSGLLTNYRDFHHPRVNGPSRGILLHDYLSSTQTVEEYLTATEKNKKIYDGYNLLICDNIGLYYQSNRKPGFEKYQSGIFGLSNAFLDTPWPKLVNGKERFTSIINHSDFEDELFDLLKNETKYPPEQLPDTGIGPDMEYMISSIFISGEIYGTRVSTIITFDYHGVCTIIEKTHSDQSLIRFSFITQK